MYSKTRTWTRNPGLRFLKPKNPGLEKCSGFGNPNQYVCYTFKYSKFRVLTVQKFQKNNINIIHVYHTETLCLCCKQVIHFIVAVNVCKCLQTFFLQHDEYLTFFQCVKITTTKNITKNQSAGDEILVKFAFKTTQ